MPHSAKNQFEPSSSLENTKDNRLAKMINRENLLTSTTYQAPKLITQPKMLTPQQIVGDGYEIIQQLETDRLITAYLVKDLVKSEQEKESCFSVMELIYDGNLAPDTVSEEIFNYQVSLIKKLSSHVQIPHLYHHWIENQQYFVVYEYNCGETLASILQHRFLSEIEVINLLQDIARICDLIAKNQILNFQILPSYILQLQASKRYVLSNLKGLFFSQVADIPLTPKQQLTLFHQQLKSLGTMVIQSLITPKGERLTKQTLPKNWHNKINLSPRLQTILAKMVAANGREHYNSLPEIAEDFQPLLRIDRLIGGKYRLSRYLGEKNGIKTYLARNLQEKHLKSALLIVKQLTLANCDRKNTATKLAYLQEEVKQFQKLLNNTLLDLVKEQFEEQEELYLVRNYIEGVSLTKKLSQPTSLTSTEVIEILKKALQSLSLFHQYGLIHRNLKPSNLIISSEDQEEQTVVLVDFGILQTVGKTNPQTNQNSVQRQPPEQIVGRPTFSSDIYSLGIAAIEILTKSEEVSPLQTTQAQEKESFYGRKGLNTASNSQMLSQNPPETESFWQTKLSFSPKLKEILERMVCSDVDKRYQSAEAVLRDLKQLPALEVEKQQKTNINSRLLAQTTTEPTLSVDQIRSENPLKTSITQPKVILIAIALVAGILAGIEWLFPLVRPQYQVYRGQQMLSTQPVIALNHFETALTLQPKKIAAWEGKGEALLALQEYLPALEAHKQALDIRPDYVASWQGTGDVLYYVGEWQEALKAYDKALSLDPHNAVSLAGKGKILARLSRYQEALSFQEKALEQENSIDVAVLSEAASSALALGKNNQALNIFSRVQNIAPLKPYLWQNEAIALRNLERPQEALENAKLILETYEQELEKQPQDLELWLGQGDFLAELKRYNNALNAYRKAISINSNEYRAWLGISQAYLKTQQYEKANQAVEKALAIKPQSFTAWHTRGLILEKGQQDLEQAVASYDRALALNQDFFPSWRDRSLALIAQNNYAQAVKSLQKAVALAPQDLESWLNLSQAYLGMAKIEEAKQAIDRVIFLQPRNSDHWLQKGSLWEKQQEYTKACDIYRQAMKIAPDLKITGAMQRVGCRSE